MGCVWGSTYELSARTVSVKRVLGEGAFSVVQLVTDTATGVDYALKVIDCGEDSDVAHAEKEAELYGKFQHRNIIPCVDRGTVRPAASAAMPNAKVLIMFPLYSKGTVQDRIDKMLNNGADRFSERELLTIFLGVCKGLAEMHRQGFAHRDLKPANVLLDDRDAAVLMDFGSVTTATVHIETRKQGLSIQGHAEENATLPFRAPELFEISTWPSDLTDRTDIWSLGCVLYTMAFHETPFELAAGQTGSLSLAIAQGKYPFPQADPYSQQVRALIEPMLQLKPHDRPSIGEVIATLEAIPGID